MENVLDDYSRLRNMWEIHYVSKMNPGNARFEKNVAISQ
jgi:hypothetical protein